MAPYKKFCELKITECAGCGSIMSVRKSTFKNVIYKKYCSKICARHYGAKNAWKKMFTEKYGDRMDLKKCPKCGEIKNLKEFYKEMPNLGRRSRTYCIKCEKSIAGSRSEYFKRYWQDEAYKKRRNERRKKLYLENIEIIREKRKKEVKDLSDLYLKKLIARYSILKESEIPKELVEWKRGIMTIKRETSK